MIAASEPLEFVPHGRTVLSKHPGHIYSHTKQTQSTTEVSLLYKLAKCDLKEDSISEKCREKDEWWMIREVYYRQTQDFKEEDSQSSKEMKEDLLSESFRHGSRLKNDFNVSIRSEIIAGLKRMETNAENANAGSSKGGSANSSSDMSKKFNLNSSHNKTPIKSKKHDPKTDSFYEEELYVKGNTAVWSKGLISSPGSRISSPESRETIACYTCDSPIKFALFCNFHINFNNTMLIDALNSQIGDEKKNIKIEDTTEHIPTQVMPSLLLLDNKCMRVFSHEGREYITSIPFQVKKIWNMKYGVLLEKDATPILHNSLLPNSFIKFNESQNCSFSKSKSNFGNMSARLRAESISGFDQECPLPTCFSLSHPLDEVTPILMKTSQNLQYYNDGDLQIIFACPHPSIVLLYDWKLGTHSLWKIRRTTRDECLAMCPNDNCTTVFSQTGDFGSRSFNVGNKHTASWMTAVGSPFNSKKGPSTPFSRSRLNSPMANIFHQQGLSPHSSIGHTSMSIMANSAIQQSPPALPLYPDICLEHIWTELQSTRRDPIENPNDSKAFLHTDLIGQDYLCYIMKIAGTSQLQMMRLQKSNCQGKSNLIVGAISSFIAKDAVVLDNLNMVALIDELGNIILQSGNQVVGKVHVGGVLARLIDSPYISRSMFTSPFPRRSSLLPSRSNDISSFDDSALHLLSPVPHRGERKGGMGLQGLVDASGNRVTLQFDKGPMYRINLPQIACSTLVLKCFDAFKAVLPKDVAIQAIIKWYGVRNAPGTHDLSPDQEWLMFTNFLYSNIGYDMEKLTLRNSKDSDINEVASKKQRTSSDGTNDDWDYLLNSKLHKTTASSLALILNLNECRVQPNIQLNKVTVKRELMEIEEDKNSPFNLEALLFPFTIHILYSLHILYEETKLNTLLCDELKLLSKVVYQLAKDLRLENYVCHYWMDFPVDLNVDYNVSESQLTDYLLKYLTQPTFFTAEPPNVFKYINGMYKGLDVGGFPYLYEVNVLTRDVVEVLSDLVTNGRAFMQRISYKDCVQAASTPRPRHQNQHKSNPQTAHFDVVSMLCQRGITLHEIDHFPPAITLGFLNIFMKCRTDPPVEWPVEAYRLITREDLALQAELDAIHKNSSHYLEILALEVLEKETAYSQHEYRDPENQKAIQEDSDIRTGMEHMDTKVLRLLYPHDHRMAEVINLLQSSVPVSINLTQRPEVSDHDFIEEQEKQLYALCTRTTALPIGRGMLTLRTLPCIPTETLHLPKLCVSGRGPPPRCNTIELTGNSGDNHQHCLLWPNFHNGVAAGLSLVPMTGSNIHSSWVIYNKPKNSTDISTEHAGFLMALGLNGHLKDMPFMNIYEYLVKCQEMTSIGLLLGLAATYRGTMDIQATKMLSIHIAPLLPTTAVELDIPHHILVAALLGLGLLYQQTCHAHMAHVLLNEIGAPTSTDTESCVEREGYALAAGLALGFVCVGAGNDAPPALAPALRTCMLGERTGRGISKEKYNKLGPSTSREGTTVNLDVTAPGATLALGLIYLKTNNKAVASWLDPPSTSYLLDDVRPDLLMLRIIARGLILWDSIEPEIEWVELQVPDNIKPYCLVKPTDDNIDYEAMNQAYVNIVTGACVALALRFAGTGDPDARSVLLHYLRRASRAGDHTCLAVLLVCAALVCAGSGDVSVLRACRQFRARVNTNTTPGQQAFTHGGQMAVGMALGLLFVGGGRCSLSTSSASIAALVAALFPKFPTHARDNRYHLQAFRHLYVLAVEPRLILPRDLSTGELCYAHLQVVNLEGVVKKMKAPCILPQLDTLKEVRLCDNRYWPIVFQRDRNWDLLGKFLEFSWCIDIKQQAGCLSYVEDPLGFQTILAQTLTLDRASTWSPTPHNIQVFTSDDKVLDFTKNYLSKFYDENPICSDCLLLQLQKKKKEFCERKCDCILYTQEELRLVQELCTITYECVIKDTMSALPVWATFLKIIHTMKTNPTSTQMWQMKILQSQMEFYNLKSHTSMNVDENEGPTEPIICNEFAISILQKLAKIFDDWEEKMVPLLKRYLGLPSIKNIDSSENLMKQILSTLIVYYELPKNIFFGVDCDNYLSILMHLEKFDLDLSAVNAIEKLFSSPDK